MKIRRSDALAMVPVVGEWSLKGLAVVNALVAIIWMFGGGFLLGTLLGALGFLQYLGGVMLQVEVRSPVLPIALGATGLSAVLLWRNHSWLALGSFACVALATLAWTRLPRSR